jgi:ActR/RegA family two-component response regulator
VNQQVRMMNERVIQTAIGQIQTGVSQYIAYTNDIDTIATPLAQPINTSTVGMKMDKNEKIGIN